MAQHLEKSHFEHIYLIFEFGLFLWNCVTHVTFQEFHRRA